LEWRSGAIQFWPGRGACDRCAELLSLDRQGRQKVTMRWRKSHHGFRWRKDAICLHCFGRSFDGGRADIQVPESVLSDDCAVGNKRDLAVVNARDSRLSVRHGDRE